MSSELADARGIGAGRQHELEAEGRLTTGLTSPRERMQSHDHVHALLHGIVGDVSQVTLLVAVIELRSGDLVPSSIS